MPLELMSDNGTPFVVWMPGVLTLFGSSSPTSASGTSARRSTRPGRTARSSASGACSSPRFSTARSSPRSRQPHDGAVPLRAYYDYHRLHGELDWQTPAERYDGTPFTDRGFEHVPALEHLHDWLTDLMAA